MSFAEDFGHDIPEDNGFDGYTGNSSGSGIRIIDDVELEHETANAYLLKIDGEKYWLPKSQVTFEDGTAEIPYWLIKSMEPASDTRKFKKL